MERSDLENRKHALYRGLGITKTSPELTTNRGPISWPVQLVSYDSANYELTEKVQEWRAQYKLPTI